MKDMILLILGLALVDLYALKGFLGRSPLLGQDKPSRKLLALGLAVAVVTLLDSLLLALLRFIPAYLTVLAGVVLALALTWLLSFVCRKPLGVWLPVIALAAAAIALLNLTRLETDGLLPALLWALGYGLGFLGALFLLEGIQRRLEPEHMPKAFRGLPIQLLAAGLLAMALTAFPI
ncbi:MAG: hypothetical protein IJK63_04105 [Oscillospiraceae bacterium]|nr:hypothetical protein [Oscillospiraceae bacterium]